MYDFAYQKPGSLSDAVKLLSDDMEAKALAGGQTFIPVLKQRLNKPSTVVDLASAVPVSDQGGVFVLDMGEPVRIVDLARQMIRLAGLRVADDGAPPEPGAIAIAFTGLRPGEKLFEELFHGAEAPVPTPYPGLLMANPRSADPAIVGRAIDEVAALCRAGQTAAALAALSRLVPEFRHNPTGDAAQAAPKAVS